MSHLVRIAQMMTSIKILDSIKDYDNIILLENGKVVEQGSHKALINKKNLYYNLENS